MAVTLDGAISSSEGRTVVTQFPQDGRVASIRVADELGDAIRDGIILPNAQLSLSELAERSKLKVESLRSALEPLVAARLLRLCGQHAVVTELDGAEQSRLSHLQQVVSVDLHGRACGVIPPAELDSLESLLTSVDPHLGHRIDMHTWGQVMRLFTRKIVAPVAAKVEYETLCELDDANNRYQILGWSALLGPDAQGSSEALKRWQMDRIASCYEQLDALRMGNIRSVLHVARDRQGTRHLLGEASLTYNSVEPRLIVVK